MFDWRILEAELVDAFSQEGLCPIKATPKRILETLVAASPPDAGDWIINIDDTESVIIETINITDIAKYLAEALNRKIAA